MARTVLWTTGAKDVAWMQMGCGNWDTSGGLEVDILHSTPSRAAVVRSWEPLCPHENNLDIDFQKLSLSTTATTPSDLHNFFDFDDFINSRVSLTSRCTASTIAYCNPS